MPLQRFKQDDEWVVEIPEKLFVCPQCGAGYERNSKDEMHGLYSDDDRESLPGDLFYDDELILCSGMLGEDEQKCDWQGGAGQIYRAAVKKTPAAEAVPCPCCKGTGSVAKKKAAAFKAVLKALGKKGL
jgi:hypothetical protein